MATKSISKDIVIKSRESGRKLDNALKQASNKKAKYVTFSKHVEELRGDAIKRFFEDF